MNMFKKNGGFTLVELIVVIAILAILAAVAVPAYSGYITKANDSAVESKLVAVLTGAQAAAAMDGKTVEVVSITSAGAITAYTDEAAEDEVVITAFYQDGPVDLSQHSEFSNGCNWTEEDGWTAGVYSAD